MRKLVPLLMLAVMASAPALRAAGADAGPARPGYAAFWAQIKQVIERHLQRPYVWGSSGMKSFDCSGFVWRVMHENGVFVKRTTARKFYMCLPEIRGGQEYTPGTVIFFDDLKHCGIVADEKSFYHAESSIGTNLSKFDPYWRPKIFGFRAFPKDTP